MLRFLALPNDGGTSIKLFRQQHIPKIRFFDLDKDIERRSPYPYMAISELNIRNKDTVVLYDSKDLWRQGLACRS
ncbi:thiosulfate/3-mercaptopyruvate sulfurtransferase 1, mitochondrial [Colletotrichum liriopes]|uniref:Thiosulfate/3-mercaptopyruvate sulfurtransferase 1, mitochondrial n=1 Tax=Colletotrichum liriopes TaxID=708192 RepID=A0AA37GUC4_9PEZI|nr:thiosulfate/3-mercaptopyruvate sulfurtransferase 1, mitochondrial [Colletotrichum liriopes]